MTRTMRATRTTLMMATLVGALLSLPRISLAAAQGTGAAAQAQQQSASDNDAAARLNKKQFHNVSVTVDNGIATLTGTTDLYDYKADAAKRVLKAKGVTAVRNLIEVAGPNVPDNVLGEKLMNLLSFDRVVYGGNPNLIAFNSITVSVRNGVVTLGGHARTQYDKNTAMTLAATYPGVKNLVDEIQVDPVSMVDDHTRMAVAHAVYGYPSMTKYSMDPGKPIRISVQNGHVELYGTVDSLVDKNTAYLRASNVPGVFTVENHLLVAAQPSGRQN
jgi:hyperosmotically inducible protein